MTTTAIGSSTPAKTTTPTGSAKTLQSSDFINLLITQLKNQDPTQPMSNSELLQQVSQIGQLQSQDQLQSSLKGLVLQNQIGSASNLIGKKVTGTDADSNTINGIVTSISVDKDTVNLQLDSGKTLAMANVTNIGTVNPLTSTPNTGTQPAAQ